MCFGPVSMAYDPVHMIDLLIVFEQLLLNLRAFHEKTSDMVKLRYGVGGVRQSIAEALLYTSTASCSESHDKVYSLLSLIDENESRLIGSTYRRPPAETFAKATFASIIAQNDFTILEFVHFGSSRIAGLPTWEVNFTQAQTPTDGRIHMHFPRPVTWSEDEIKNSQCVHMADEGGYLSVKGVPIGFATKILGLPSADPNTKGCGNEQIS